MAPAGRISFGKRCCTPIARNVPALRWGAAVDAEQPGRKVVRELKLACLIFLVGGG